MKRHPKRISKSPKESSFYQRIFENISPADLFIILFSIVLFCYTYWVDVSRPGPISPLGYYQSWWDQSQYYNMAVGISQGNLGSFNYPVGYPFFGFLGLLIYPGDPFLPIDFVGFVLFIWLAYVICKKFFNKSLSLISGVLLALVAVQSFVTPWTTTISAICLVYILYITVHEKYGHTEYILAGLCVGLAFAARIGDIIPVLFAYAFYIGYPIITEKKVTISRLIGIPVAAAIIGITLIVDFAFSGKMLGNYAVGATNLKYFDVISMPYNVFGFFLNTFTFGGETHTLSIPFLKFFFLFVFVPLGLYLLLKTENQKRKGLLFLTVLLGWCIVYLAHVGISATALKFEVGYHYEKMLFPIFIISAMTVIDEFSKLENQKDEAKKFLKTILLYLTSIAVIIILFTNFFNFSQIQLNQNNIKITASNNQALTPHMIDNNPATRWDSGAPQKTDMSIFIALDRDYLINRIVLDSTPIPAGTPTQVEIYYSKDNIKWEKEDFATYTGFTSGLSNIYFPPFTAKYVKITLPQDSPNWWTIYELKIYGR
jgi:hypothetical protein